MGSSAPSQLDTSSSKAVSTGSPATASHTVPTTHTASSAAIAISTSTLVMRRPPRTSRPRLLPSDARAGVAPERACSKRSCAVTPCPCAAAIASGESARGSTNANTAYTAMASGTAAPSVGPAKSSGSTTQAARTTVTSTRIHAATPLHTPAIIRSSGSRYSRRARSSAGRAALVGLSSGSSLEGSIVPSDSRIAAISAVVTTSRPFVSSASHFSPIACSKSNSRSSRSGSPFRLTLAASSHASIAVAPALSM